MYTHRVETLLHPLTPAIVVVIVLCCYWQFVVAPKLDRKYKRPRLTDAAAEHGVAVEKSPAVGDSQKSGKSPATGGDGVPLFVRGCGFMMGLLGLGLGLFVIATICLILWKIVLFAWQ